jgi:hypothetical protein
LSRTDDEAESSQARILAQINKVIEESKPVALNLVSELCGLVQLVSTAEDEGRDIETSGIREFISKPDHSKIESLLSAMETLAWQSQADAIPDLSDVESRIGDPTYSEMEANRIAADLEYDLRSYVYDLNKMDRATQEAKASNGTQGTLWKLRRAARNLAYLQFHIRILARILQRRLIAAGFSNTLEVLYSFISDWDTDRIPDATIEVMNAGDALAVHASKGALPEIAKQTAPPKEPPGQSVPPKSDVRSEDTADENGNVLAPADERTYRPASKIVSDNSSIVADIKALKKLLAAHPEIRRWKPRANRLSVHIVDWQHFLDQQRRDGWDDNPDGVERRKADIRGQAEDWEDE